MTHYEIAIVGNGILGLSTAFFLHARDPTIQIAIIGRSIRMGAATTAAGAMFNCFGEVTARTLTSPYHRIKFEWAVESLKRWTDFLPLLDLDNQAGKGGTYVILNSRNGGLDDENFAAVEQALIKTQTPFSEVDPAGILGLNPIMDYRPLRALHIPIEHHINPNRVIDRLEKIHQAMSYDAEVNKITMEKSFHLLLDDGTRLTADKVLIAAGAASQSLIDQFPEIKRRIPRVLSSVGTSMVLKAPDIPLDSVVRTPSRAGACGFHMLPLGEGDIYAGATAYFSETLQTQERMRYPYNLMRNIIHQFNQTFEDAKIQRMMTGNRPVTSDGFPLMGQTSVPGLWILTGTNRDGFHDAPLLCEDLACRILKQPPLLDNPFLPERKPLQTMTQLESIAEAVKHAVAVNYEYGITMPISGDDLEATFAKGLRRRFEEIYETLGTEVALPVEMLVMFLRNEKDKLLMWKEIYNAWR